MPDNDNIDNLSDKDLRNLVADLRKEVSSLRDEVKGMTKKGVKDLDKNLKYSNNVVSDLINNMKTLNAENLDFIKNTSKQYSLAESLAQSYKQTSVNIGLTTKNQQDFGRVFIKSVADVQMFGGNMQDVQSAYSNFADESGRIRILSPDEITNIIALEKGTNLVGDSAAELMEKFDLMGVSSKDAMESINQIFVDSQKIGLNASKVVKTLSENFTTMQKYSFNNGVKGMTEMAKLSVKMRTNISDMLAMADKFYDPESAIETASNLQMLGGDIAAAFGDPIEMMYLARNEPEKLATKLQSITENMMTFNDVTGQYEFPPEVRMQLKAAGEQLGINTDQMIEMARQTSKIKDIKMNVSSNITDDDMREQISSMAKMKDGKWVIDTKDGELAIDSEKLTKDLVSELVKVPKTQEEAIITTAKEALTTNQYLETISKSRDTAFLSEANIYMAMEKAFEPSLKTFVEGQKETMDTIRKSFGETQIQQQIQSMLGGGGTKLDDLVGGIMKLQNDLVTEFLGTVKNKEFKFDKIDVNELGINSNGKISIINSDGKPSVIANDDFASFPSGQRMISGPEGNFKINDNDLVVGGTNLFDNKKTNASTNLSGTLVIDMPSTITVNVAGDSKNVDLNDSNLKNIILKYVETSLRDGVDNSKVSGSGIYTTPGNQSFK